MPEGHVDRIVRESGVHDLVDILSTRLSPTDLQSLMMEVYRRRAGQILPGGLLSRFEQDRFSQPAAVSPRATSDLEHLVWAALPEGYEGIELSPLCPMGTNSVVATVDQRKVVTTDAQHRGCGRFDQRPCPGLRTEAPAPPGGQEHPVHAGQPGQLPASGSGSGVRQPRGAAHFRLIGLASAGRDEGSFAFETRSLCEQIGFFVDVVGRAKPGWRARVAVTDLCGRSPVWETEVLTTLADRFPDLVVEMDSSRASGRGYYVDACYKLFFTADQGKEIEVGDGGCTTWTRQLLSDAKERLVISGLGAERLLG